MRYFPAILISLLSTPAWAVPLVSLEGDGAGLPELDVLQVGEEFDEALADRSLQEAAASLAAEGYLDAHLDPRITQREGGIVLRVELTRGERATLGELTVNGARAVEPRLVEAAARTGWRRDGPRGLQRAVDDLYASMGYLEVGISLGRPKRTADGALDITLELMEGGLTGVGAIEVIGLEGEPSRRTARLALGLEHGDPLTPDVLDAARRRLELTGYYERIELTIEGEAGPLTTLRLDLEPGRSVYFDGALGLGEFRDEIALFGEFQFNVLNLGGGGHDLSGLYRQTAEDNADYRAGYTKRYVFGGRAALGIAYIGLRRFDRRSDTGEVSVRQPLGDHLVLRFAARFSSDFQNITGDSFYVGAGLGVLLDHTDRPRNPTDGYDLWCELEAGQRRFEERNETPLRARLGGDVYWTPLDPHTLALLVEGGIAEVKQPASLDCFYLGGAQRPRGDLNREFPTDAYALATTEYRLRLGESGHLFAFGDFAYYRPISTTPSAPVTAWRLGMGYGVGLVVSLSVGSLEVVYALSEGSRLDSGTLLVRLVLDRL